MALLPGWIILRDAAMTLIQVDLADMDEQSAGDLVEAFEWQVRARVKEQFPEERVFELLQLVGDGIVLIFGQWPGWVLEFFVSHGGEAAINDFLARHPTWRREPCACCEQLNVFDSEDTSMPGHHSDGLHGEVVDSPTRNQLN